MSAKLLGLRFHLFSFLHLRNMNGKLIIANIFLDSITFIYLHIFYQSNEEGQNILYTIIFSNVIHSMTVQTVFNHIFISSNCWITNVKWRYVKYTILNKITFLNKIFSRRNWGNRNRNFWTEISESFTITKLEILKSLISPPEKLQSVKCWIFWLLYVFTFFRIYDPGSRMKVLRTRFRDRPLAKNTFDSYFSY